jgi:50S ribosomal subunit-associated GTPase HflX
VVATKIDGLDEPERLEALRARAQADGRHFFAVSSVTGEGVKQLVRAVGNEVELHRTPRLLSMGDDVRASSRA